MTRLITKAALLTACGMLVAAAAMAGVPNAGTSTSPAFIRLVGNTTLVPDSAKGKITITVNDVAHNPIAGSNVVVDFSGCVTSDIKIASNQLNANYTTSCATHSVSAYTNASGVVAFTLLGSSFSTGTHSVAGCARIYADGVLLSSPTVATPDMDGANGVSAADLSAVLGDVNSHVYRARADIDGGGTLSAADLSAELGVVNAHKSNSSAAAYCP